MLEAPRRALLTILQSDTPFRISSAYAPETCITVTLLPSWGFPQAHPNEVLVSIVVL